MINLLLVLNIIVVSLLICIILLQKSEGGVLGMGGSGSKNGLFTARSAGNIITKTTYILGAMFFVICMLLAIFVSQKNEEQSFMTIMEKKNKEIDKVSFKTIPEKNIQDEIKKEIIKDEISKKPSVPLN